MRLGRRRWVRGTSRRELETLVRERTAQLELAIDQMESADTIIDRWTIDGVIRSMNQFGLETFGFTEEEVVGQRAMGSIVPDDPERLAEWVAVREELLANPYSNAHSELECRRKDGSPVWIAFRNRPILDADDNIVEIFSVGIDITERRLREARLAAEKRRMEDELNIGREIQLSLLPERFPAFPDRSEFTVHAALEAAREVGGDFYDFFLVDGTHLCVCVGDVSDKGVPAALYMAVTKTLINSRGANDLSPASILTHVNDELCKRNGQSMFVTIFLAVLDTRTGEFRYSNAGHNPPYLTRSDGSVFAISDRHGPAAGIIPGFAYRSDALHLHPGDTVVMFTDGVTEAMNPDRELFGEERLEELLISAGTAQASEVVDRIFAEVAAHSATADPSDDVTVLTVAFHGGRSPARAQLDLTLHAGTGAIGSTLERFDEWMDERSVPDHARRATLVIADDLLNNVVSHAGDGRAPTIEASLELDDQRVQLTVTDDGPPFNPFLVETPNVATRIDERDVGGLGIHLVRNLMEEHHYSRLADRNIVRVARRLAEPERGVGT